jgi:hypothetical protein
MIRPDVGVNDGAYCVREVRSSDGLSHWEERETGSGTILIEPQVATKESGGELSAWGVTDALHIQKCVEHNVSLLETEDDGASQAFI